MGTVVLNNVSKVFGSTRGSDLPVIALESVDLEVKDGEFLCLLGPTGCGKSTILNLIAGFDKASAGEVTLDGQRIDGPGPDRGVVFQEHALFPWFTVNGNALFGPRMRSRLAQEARDEARRVLELVGLKGTEERYPHQLSGGMKQRVAIARVLLNTPEILLMDEPFGSLDAITRTKMQELLLQVWEHYRSTVLFITHDVDEAIILADRVVVLSQRPARIDLVKEIALCRPRSYDMVTSDAFMAIKREVMDALG